MSRRIRWCTLAVFLLASLIATPSLAQEGGGGGGGGGEGGGGGGDTHVGDVFGDLIHVKRDPLTGQPILQKRWIEYPQDLYDWGYCPIPIDANGDELPFAPLSCDVDPAFVTATVEVDYFGRLSGGRTRERNIRMHFDEVIDKIKESQLVNRDAAGRLVMATGCTVTPEGLDLSTCVWKTVDSPQENLAVYNRLMRYGHLQTDPLDVDVDFHGDPATGTVYHPALTASDYRKFQGLLTAALPVAPANASSCFGGSTFTCDDPQALTSSDFAIAVSMLGGAADKTGIITPDLVQYLNRILKVTTSTDYAGATVKTLPALIRDCGSDETNVIVSVLSCTIAPAAEGLAAPANERFVDFGVMQYDRSTMFGGVADVIRPSGTGTWALATSQAIWPFLAFKNPGHETGVNMPGFVNAGNDALRAVEFMHEYAVPADLGWDFTTIVPNPAPIVVTSITSDLLSPQYIGRTITFTAAATGGVAPLQYKWWLKTGDTWTMLQTWSVSNTLIWTPDVAGDSYQIGVWVRHADSVADATIDAPEDSAFISIPYTIAALPPIRIQTITPSLPAPQLVGTTVTFTAVAEGGVEPYQYKWWILDGSTWTVAADWSASNTFEWAPVAAKPYHVGVWVRSNGNLQDVPEGPSSYLSIAYEITARPAITVTALTSDLTAPQVVGTTITFTAAASGGGAPYEYRWWLFDGSIWNLARDYTADPTFAWTPDAVNVAYHVGVWVRSSGNTDSTNPESLTAYTSVPFAITVDGGEYANNLSVPVVFAEGIGLTGQSTAIDTGLRPTAQEPGGASRVVAATPAAMFEAAEAYTKEGVSYFPQQTSSTWQADWRDGLPQGERVVVDWSDTLLKTQFAADAAIPVETVLYESSADTMRAFRMQYLFGSAEDEMWGTDSTTLASHYRTVFAATARLRIQRITGPGGDVVPEAPHFDGSVAQQFATAVPTPFAAAVNVGGGLVYRYDWRLNEWPGSAAEKAGWWRLTFNLDPSATYALPGVDGTTTARRVQRNATFEAADPGDMASGVRFPPRLVDPYTTVVEIEVGAGR